MDLFTFLVDDLEDELAQAGIRRVQFCLNGEQYQTRNLDFADDVVLLIEHEEEIQPALDTIQSFYLKRRLYPKSPTLQSERSSCMSRKKKL